MTAPTTTTATVTFAAPGDDGATGVAASYDLRYATAPITDATWAAATQVAGEPTPGVAGTATTISVTGLTASTTYYFALKTSDEVPNLSALSNVPSVSTAAFAITYTKAGAGGGTVTSAPAGLTCAASCSASFMSGTAVTLTATPAAGSTFTGWSGTGGCVGTAACALSMTAARAVTATFAVTDSTAPAPVTNLAATAPTTTTATVTFTAPGDDGATGTATSYDLRYATVPITDATWAAATQVTGEPTPGVAGTATTISVTGLTPSTTYYFAVKAIDEASNAAALSNAATASTSVFTITYTLAGTGGGTVTSVPAGVSCTASCAGAFMSGTVVTLTATPAAGATFVGWSGTGGCTGAGTCALTMTANRLVTATFTSGDATAPGAVTNLAATAATTTTATVTFTAPGDDGATGTATSYDLRYATAPITDATWAAATQVAGEPTPGVAGTATTISVSGLTASTTYYFALKTSDEVPNLSALSNVPSATTPGSGFALTYTRAGTGAGTVTSAPAGLSCATPAPEGVGRGASWRYRDVGVDLGTAWRSGTYDDGAWASGPGPLGYGETYVVTTVGFGPNSASKYITTYFRKQFTVADPAVVTRMLGEVLYDDGFVVYLNGVEVARSSSMPGGTVTAASLALDHEPVGVYEAFDWTSQQGLLVAGVNTLAVEVHQVDPTTSDLVFDLALSLPTGCAATFASGTAVTLTATPAAGSTFTGWSGTGGCTGTGTCALTMTAAKAVTAAFTLAGDTTAPGAVTNLAVTAPTTTTATVTFTAPGDDGATGTATSYDLRYATAPITDATWAAATQVAGEPVPGAAGTATTINVTGLTASTTYYFALRTNDEVPNLSAFSNVPSVSTAAFAITYTLAGTGGGTVTSAPAGLTCAASCAGAFMSGTAVTLTATPAAGSTFTGWSGTGGCVGTGTCALTMSAAKAVTATFTAADATAPGAVTNLAVTAPTTTTATVTFTAPGDDGATGTAASYDLRYATAPITDATWAAATQVAGEPAPGAAGTATTINVTGLTASTTYYFALRTNDEVPNLSAFSNVPSVSTAAFAITYTLAGTGGGTVTSAPAGLTCAASCAGAFMSGTAVTLTATPAAGSTFTGWSGTGGCVGTGTCALTMSAAKAVTATFTATDSTAPGAVTNLAVTAPTTTTATVTFTAPGDDGATGTATSYDLRYATAPITDATWAAATQVAGEPTPGVAGTATTISVTGLTASTTYYFALRTSDEVPNPSALSNVPSVSTAAFAVTYTKAGAGGGTVTSAPAGLSCAASCSASFMSGTAVTLTATPAAGSTFSGWSGTGGCTGTATCVLTMTAARAITATFAADTTAPGAVTNLAVTAPTTTTATVTFTAPGDDGATGTATSYDLRYATAPITDATWAAATQVAGEPTPGAAGTATTISVSGLTASTTYYFALKASDEVPNPSALSNVPSVSTAAFAITYTKAGAGGGTVASAPAGLSCPASCSASFMSGTAVTLTATPAAGSTFTGWSGTGGCTGTATCVLTMAAARAVTATFAVGTFALTVTKAGTGTGTVTSSPAGINCGATCTASFTGGASVTLTAAPAAGSVFAGWSGTGGCTGTGTCIVAMAAATSVTATFAPSFALTVTKAGTGSGTVTSSPAGIACGATCATTFASGAVVTLTATPAAGSRFAGWSGTGGCTGIGTCTLTMSAAKAATATFSPGAQLTVAKDGTGTGTVASDVIPGIDCGATCAAAFAANTVVNLVATADGGALFTGWSGACTGTDPYGCTVTLSASANVTATFTRAYLLTVAATGSGGGMVLDPDGISAGGAYPSGTSLTLRAQPSDGSAFTGWSGACAGLGTCTIVMDADKAVTAAFAAGLTVVRAGTGVGTVVSTPPGIDCGATCGGAFPDTTFVTLTPVPAPGSIFAGWTGACQGTATCIVAKSARKKVYATFTATTVARLVASKAGAGNGWVTANGSPWCDFSFGPCTWDAGAVTLAAIAAEGSVFTGWSGACSGTSACAVTVDQAYAVTATFAAVTRPNIAVVVGGSGTGRVTSSPPPINCSGGTGGCSADFIPGATVTLTATPTSGKYVFNGWAGACTGTGPCVLTAGQPQTVSAVFAELVPLRVVKHRPWGLVGATLNYGLGVGTVTADPGGTICNDDCLSTYSYYEAGSLVTLSGTPSANAGTPHWASFFGCGNFFGDWMGNLPLEMTPQDCTQLVWVNFPQTSFTISGNAGRGGVTVSSSTILWYQNFTATTDAYGDYQIVGDVWANTSYGNYIAGITPSHPTCSFAPVAANATIADAVSVAGVDFVPTCPAPAFTISGNVGPPGVAVTATSATATESGVSVAGGDYLVGVDAGTYTVTPAKIGCTFTPASQVVTVPGDALDFTAACAYPLTIVRRGEVPGVVTASVGGLDCGATCTGSFAPGTQVALTARPAIGAKFVGWSGACTGADPNACVVAMDQAQRVTATYANAMDFLVEAAAAPAAALAATAFPISFQVRYRGDPAVNLLAWTTPPSVEVIRSSDAVHGNADDVVVPSFGMTWRALGVWSIATTASATAGTYYYFARTNWADRAAESDASNNASGPMRVDVGSTGVGVTNLAETGRVESLPAGLACDLVSPSSTCVAGFAPGTLVTLTATPAAGSVFGSWTGCASVTANRCTVTVGASGLTSVSVRFAPSRYGLAVARRGTGGGVVRSTPVGAEFCMNWLCTQSHAAGSTVALTAVADAASTFTGWTGACSGTSPTCQVTMDAAKEVAAVFVPGRALAVSLVGLGHGTVTSDVAAVNEVSLTDSATYAANQSRRYGTFDVAPGGSLKVGLTAGPNGWGNVYVRNNGLAETYSYDCYASTGNPRCVVAGPGAVSLLVKASYADVYALALDYQEPSSLPFIDCGPTCTGIRAGTVTLTATPAADSVFTGWGGACAGTPPVAPCVVSLAEAAAVVATFAPYTPTLSIAVTGSGSVTTLPDLGTCAGTCQRTYAYDTRVTLQPVAIGNAVFAGWTGACLGSGPCEVAMTAARSVQATFEPAHPVTVTLAGTGTGTVTSSPAGITCQNTGGGSDCTELVANGTPMLLTAIEPVGSIFAGWSGACTGTAPTCTVSATAIVTATFTARDYAVAVAKTGPGGGTVAVTAAAGGYTCGATCTGRFGRNAVVTFTVTPDTASTFTGWNPGSGCTSNPCTRTITADTTVSANFDGWASPPLVVVPPVPEYQAPADAMRDDDGNVIFGRSASIQLVVDSTPSPIVALNGCALAVTNCYLTDAGSLDECMRSAPTCGSTMPWNEPGTCCAAECWSDYALARAAGVGDIDAFRNVLFGASSCMPGVDDVLGANAGLAAAPRQQILDAHNARRASHCAPPLRWSADLAIVAQSWADDLAARGCLTIAHSPAAIAGRYGENLWWAPAGAFPYATDAVQRWYGEGQDYDYGVAGPRGTAVVGHFTQVVWKATSEVGCAVVACGGLDVLVCDYAAPGNYIGEFAANVLNPATCTP